MLPTKLTNTSYQKTLGIFSVITVLSLQLSDPSRHVLIVISKLLTTQGP